MTNHTDGSKSTTMDLSSLYCMPDIYSEIWPDVICPERGEVGGLSMMILVGETQRLGCDDIPSSMMAVDSCGVCGGSDSCYDCMKVAHGSK